MGWAITNAQHDEDMALIREMGATVVRLSHYEHAEHFHDLARSRAASSLWAEIPLVNENANTTAFTDNAVQQMTELIRQNYNHPSVAVLGHRQRAAQRRHRHQQPADRAEHPGAQGGSGPPLDLRAVLHQRHGRRCPRTATWSATTRTTAGTTPSAPPTSSAPGPTSCTRRSRPGRSASASTAPAPASRSTPTTRQPPIPTAAPPGGVAEPGARGALEADEDAPLPVGEDDLEHVRLRRRQPQRGRHARAATTRAWSPTTARPEKDAFFWYKANWTTAPFVYITSRRFNPRTTADDRP